MSTAKIVLPTHASMPYNSALPPSEELDLQDQISFFDSKQNYSSDNLSDWKISYLTPNKKENFLALNAENEDIFNTKSNSIIGENNGLPCPDSENSKITPANNKNNGCDNSQTGELRVCDFDYEPEEKFYRDQFDDSEDVYDTDFDDLRVSDTDSQDENDINLDLRHETAKNLYYNKDWKFKNGFYIDSRYNLKRKRSDWNENNLNNICNVEIPHNRTNLDCFKIVEDEEGIDQFNGHNYGENSVIPIQNTRQNIKVTKSATTNIGNTTISEKINKSSTDSNEIIKSNATSHNAFILQDVEQVVQQLSGVDGLGSKLFVYISLFRRASIDGIMLEQLNSGDLFELGIRSSLHRSKILSQIHLLLLKSQCYNSSFTDKKTFIKTESDSSFYENLKADMRHVSQSQIINCQKDPILDSFKEIVSIENEEKILTCSRKSEIFDDKDLNIKQQPTKNFLDETNKKIDIKFSPHDIVKQPQKTDVVEINNKLNTNRSFSSFKNLTSVDNKNNLFFISNKPIKKEIIHKDESNVYNRRSRSENRSQLTFCEEIMFTDAIKSRECFGPYSLPFESNNQDIDKLNMDCYDDKCQFNIRVQKNQRNLKFYDCSCGRRKPVQDLRKIRNHIASIHLNKRYFCRKCKLEFKDYHALGGHNKRCKISI